MPHIHTNKGEHDHTASAYIIRTDQENITPKIMLHKHKKHGVYMQFGGHIELNEDPWQAISHELREEAGYDIAKMKLLQPKAWLSSLDSATAHPAPFCHNTHAIGPDHYHSDLCYLLIADGNPTETPDEGESEDFGLFDAKELNAVPDKELFPNVRQTALFALKIFEDDNSGWHQVPTSTFGSLV